MLAGLIESIPLAALAGLLVHVGAKLVNPKHIKDVHKHGDLPLYLVTLAGVLIGIAFSLVLMLRRMMWSGIHAENDERVVIEGALTFLSVPRLSTVLNSLPKESTVTVELVVDDLVPAHHSDMPDDTSVGASVEYAVKVLGVREIAVCGHSSCGAMKALLDEGGGELPSLTRWLHNGKPSLDQHAQQPPATPMVSAGPRPSEPGWPVRSLRWIRLPSGPVE